MKKIIFFVLTICVAAELFAQAEPHEYLNATARFKKFYNANKPDSIFTNFSEAMKKALPEDKFRSSTLQLRNQLGSLQKTELVKYNSPLAVYKATFQNGTFLKGRLINRQWAVVFYQFGFLQ